MLGYGYVQICASNIKLPKKNKLDKIPQTYYEAVSECVTERVLREDKISQHWTDNE